MYNHTRRRGFERRAAKEDYVLSHSATAAEGAAVTNAQMPMHPSNVSSETLLERIQTSLSDDKAEDVVTIDLRGKSEIADYMVIASGRSTRQVTSIAEKLNDRLKHDFGRMCKLEGKSAGDWVLIDAGDVIVHVFRPEVREFYQLEKMWMSPGEATVSTT